MDQVPKATHQQRSPARSPLKARRPEWIDAFELKVRVEGLPQNWTTLDLYKIFCPVANIVRIELNGPGNGRGLQGYVTFRPPPTVMSTTLEGFEIRDQDGRTHRVRCSVSWQSRPYERESPLDPSRKFPEIIAVPMGQLEIGAMHDEDEMLVLRKFKSMPKAPLELELNLRLKVLDLNFGITFPVEGDHAGHGLTVQRFRVRVTLSQLRNLKKVAKQDGQVALVFGLELPPLLFRKVESIEDTHEQGSSLWYEDNAWYRQTSIDITRDQTHAATKLPNESAVYDVGRWLAFCLTFTASETVSQAFNTFGQALIDHNVDVTQTKSIAFTHGDPEHLWDWLGYKRETGHASSLPSSIDELHLITTPSVHLEFSVLYQLQVCLSQGVLHECNLTSGWARHLSSLDPARAARILEKIVNDKRRYYNPMEIFRLQASVSVKPKQIPRYCALIRSAVVTPTMIYFATPVLETSNRVIREYRQYEDRFLRVKFTDERYKGRIMASGDNTKIELLTRVKRTMTNGIKIGGRHYDFLAFGNSQFRENGAYFFASTGGLTADSIRARMGDFTNIRTVAKYASRIGQCFSTTRAMQVGVNIARIADVERNGFCFSDGVGKISPFLAQMIAEEFGLPDGSTEYPSVFQFRLGGCKGVLAVDPNVKGREVQIRPSQEKFPAKYYGLEICRISQYSSAYLNMQVILVLDALGVPPSAFIQKMREALTCIEEAMSNPRVATEQLRKKIDFNQTTLTIATMVDDGFMEVKDPFTMSCLYLWRSWMIKYLKEKAKIFVDDGAFVLGCMDETATLRGHYSDPAQSSENGILDAAELPEIFLQVPDPAVKGKYKAIEGICTLARNPCLHPGDMRVVRAVDVPGLHHLKNVVVLPQNGDRDLANMCSGGDLDGDDYLVMWDPALLPQEWNHPPMDYQAPAPVISAGPVTVDDITSFFVTHMKNDNLGRLAVAHRYWADQLTDSVKDERCLELAQLNSRAVDYAKTGVPAEMPKRLRVTRWPHWSEVKKPGEKGFYTSKKILGMLYDEVDRVPFVPAWSLPFDRRILDAYEMSDETLFHARELKRHYDEDVRRVMAQYSIQSEFEVWTTFALEYAPGLSDYKLAESLGETVQALKQHHQEICYEQAGTNARERDWQKMAPLIAAMYAVTAEEVSAVVAECRREKMVGGRLVPVQEMNVSEMPFMSFPWIFARELGQIANKRSAQPSTQRVSTARPTLPKKQNDVDLLGNDFALEPLKVINTVDGAVHAGDLLDVFHKDEPVSLPPDETTKTVTDLGRRQPTPERSGSRNSPASGTAPVANDINSSIKSEDAGIRELQNDTTNKVVEDDIRSSIKSAAIVIEELQRDTTDEVAEEDSEEAEDIEEVVISMDEKPSALDALEKLLGRQS